MGLDAIVHCNCYKEGKLQPFPLREYEQYLRWDDEGGVELDLPYEGNEALFSTFEEWRALDACEHEDFIYRHQRISNWSGYRSFQEAVEQIGWSFFPTLEAELPESNGGVTSPEAATVIIDELAVFAQKADFGSNTFLVDTTTNNIIYEYIAAYEGLFQYGALYLGVDLNGFFVVKPAGESRASAQGEELFRATRFEQRILERNEKNMPLKVEFYNADTEQRLVCNAPISVYQVDENGKLQPHHPRLMHVEKRRIGAEYYDYIVKPLISICQAAIETGNPVVWC